MSFTVEQLAAATSAPYGNAQTYHPHLEAAMCRFEIEGLLRQAAFFATLAVESVNLSKTEEDLYYKDAARLARIYPRAFKDAAAALPYTRNSKGLGELLYKYAGVTRTPEGLTQGIAEIRALREEFWADVRVVGTGDQLNQELERAGRIADYLEMAELLCLDEPAAGLNPRESAELNELLVSIRDRDGIHHVVRDEHRRGAGGA